MHSPQITDVNSWRGLRERMRTENLVEVNVPASELPAPSKTDVLHYADLLSYNPDTDEVYRDDVPRESLQVRVFSGRYNVQLDRHNPEYDPIAHLLEDVIGKEIKELRPVLRGTDDEELEKIRHEMAEGPVQGAIDDILDKNDGQR